MNIREWLQQKAFRSLSMRALQWFFRVAMVLTIVDVLMPDMLPFVEEIGLGWLTFETWREIKRRQGL